MFKFKLEEDAKELLEWIAFITFWVGWPLMIWQKEIKEFFSWLS